MAQFRHPESEPFSNNLKKRSCGSLTEESPVERFGAHEVFRQAALTPFASAHYLDGAAWAGNALPNVEIGKELPAK